MPSANIPGGTHPTPVQTIIDVPPKARLGYGHVAIDSIEGTPTTTTTALAIDFKLGSPLPIVSVSSLHSLHTYLWIPTGCLADPLLAEESGGGAGLERLIKLKDSEQRQNQSKLGNETI